MVGNDNAAPVVFRPHTCSQGSQRWLEGFAMTAPIAYDEDEHGGCDATERRVQGGFLGGTENGHRWRGGHECAAATLSTECRTHSFDVGRDNIQS